MQRTQCASGKAKEAEELVKRAVELFKLQKRNENAANILLNLGGNMVFLGKCQQAKDHVNAAMALFRSDLGLAGAAMVYAACGDAVVGLIVIDAVRAAAPGTL